MVKSPVRRSLDKAAASALGRCACSSPVASSAIAVAVFFVLESERCQSILTATTVTNDRNRCITPQLNPSHHHLYHNNHQHLALLQNRTTVVICFRRFVRCSQTNTVLSQQFEGRSTHYSSRRVLSLKRCRHYSTTTTTS